MKIRLSVDTLGIGVMIGLAIIAGVVILLGESAGVQVRVDLPEDGIVGPFEAVTFTFSEKISAEIASDLISLDPIHEGYLSAVDDYSVRYIPIKPYEQDVPYTFKVIRGEINSGTREVKKPQSWQVHVREPRVAYVVSEDGQSGIWSMTKSGGDVKRLTDEAIKVISFDVAQSGDLIVFTSVNQQGGIDLWRVSQAGGDASILLDCGFDRCTTPVIAPGDKRIAYSREAAGPTPDLPFGSPRTWVVDLQSGADQAVYEDQSILGYNPSWSPDAKRLASFDGLADFITGGPVTWSPDSTRFLYTTFEQTEEGGRTQVKLADLTTNETITFIGEKDTYDYAYYSVAWSLLEERAVLSLRADEKKPTQLLWVFDPSLLSGITVADDPEYTYNSPQWDPWGSALLFQQFKLKGQYKPEIGLWQEGTNQSEVIVEGI
ncbi:MAG: hypothetical protein HYU84_16875, partial [Chloroflexi bacterium]|nr:hypothetical protein [Chloroflexota bacterium]